MDHQRSDEEHRRWSSDEVDSDKVEESPHSQDRDGCPTGPPWFAGIANGPYDENQ